MVESNEDSFGVLRLLESAHSFESCIEVTDVRLKPVRGVGDSWIDEVREGMAAGFFEALQDVLMDGIQSEDVRRDETFQMLPAQKESLRRGMQQQLAVPEEDSLLYVARMSAESLELQSGLQITQQVNVAALDVDPVGLQNLRQAWQTIDGDRREDRAALENLLQEVIKDLRGFFAGTEPACEQSCRRVPHQIFAVLLSVNGECFAIKYEDAAWHMRVRKDGTREITVQILQDGDVALCTRRPHPAVGAAIENVAIVKGRSRFPASALDSERMFAGVAFPPATTEPDGVSGTAKCALFFMDELGEG